MKAITTAVARREMSVVEGRSEKTERREEEVAEETKSC
jgi:hypothetical protein